ncbi:MAG TPA: CorA family divalent cation transporter [Streptosporangiaceae bacterium]
MTRRPNSGAVAWLDLYEPTEADLQIVTEEFGLHPLAVEDAISPHQRPKVDRYRTSTPTWWTPPTRSAA